MQESYTDKPLYSIDELVSTRITWDNNRVLVNYYTPEDIKIPWWKLVLFFVYDSCDDVNKKNKYLHQEASAVSRAKKLFPPKPYPRYSNF